MPGLTIERPKMTRTMYQALKRHIIKEREKKKQEQEEDALMERLKTEKAQRKKKEEENSLTLEQTKEQIQQLEEKLVKLREEKHELFFQLKKLLNQEDDARRRAQTKEQNELLSLPTPYGIPVSSHSMLMQPGRHMSGRPTLYNPPQPMMPQGIKRTRTPSPTPSSMYQPAYKAASYTSTPAKHQPGTIHPRYPPSAEFKHAAAYPQTEVVTYTTGQTGAAYQQQGTIPITSQSETSNYTPAGQSAFTHYPSHYAHQQKHAIQADPYNPAYPHMQRVQQPGYVASHTGAISIQQQLDHASQKSGFSKEEYKHVGGHVRVSMAGGQQPSMIPQQITLQQQQQQQQAKTGIAGYQPPRGQAPLPPTSSYQPTTSQVTYSSQSGTPARPHTYPGQQATHYF